MGCSKVSGCVRRYQAPKPKAKPKAISKSKTGKTNQRVKYTPLVVPDAQVYLLLNRVKSVDPSLYQSITKIMGDPPKTEKEAAK